MNTYYYIQFEMQHHTSSLLSEAEQERWTRRAAAGGMKVRRDLGIQRLAIRLGDMIAGLRCQLESRFAAETRAAAC